MAAAQPQNLRADARRNRDAVLAAAREVFAAHGLGAPLSEIARRAGVGQGTLYRRFPSREALLEALADDYLDRIRALAAQTGEEPEAFLALFRALVDLQRENQGLIELLGNFPFSQEGRRRRRAAFIGLIEEPLRRAQAADVVRTDIDPEDVKLLLNMVGGASGPVADSRNGCTRAVELALDAVRPQD